MENDLKHFVFIGGSGMLLDLVKKKLSEGHKVALLCRHPPVLKGDYHPIACNYNVPEDFPNLLDQYFSAKGYADELICWMRTGSVYPFLALCELITKEHPSTRLWHLRGSSWYDDPNNLPFVVPADLKEKVDFHKIYLGSIEDGEDKRWLSNEEICVGVEQAINSAKELFCIGNAPPFDSLS